MPSYTSLTAPSSIGEAIAPLAVLQPDDLGLIASLVHGSRSFSPTKEEINTLSDRLGFSKDVVEYLFVALSVLYSHVNSETNKKIKYDDVLNETVEELALQSDWEQDVKSTILDRLAPLLKQDEVHDTFKKIGRLRAGFQPHAIGFSSLVELRPRYTDDESMELEIDAYVPVIQFRITTDSSDNKQFAFQLTESALLEFKKAIDRLEKKVEVLKNSSGTPIKLVDL